MDSNRSIPHCAHDESRSGGGQRLWQMLQFRFAFHSFASLHNGISKGIPKAVLNWFKLASCHKAPRSQSITKATEREEKERSLLQSKPLSAASQASEFKKDQGWTDLLRSLFLSEDIFFEPQIVIRENKQLTLERREGHESVRKQNVPLVTKSRKIEGHRYPLSRRIKCPTRRRIHNKRQHLCII